ncbi:MAG: hypothetical protein ACLQGP_18995 [Isosphaeraceae bacterium]
MNVGSLETTRRRASAIGTTMIAVVALTVANDPKIARAQGAGRVVPQSRGQGMGAGNSVNPYSVPLTPGRYWSYPVKDPTAAERAEIAGRVYRGLLDGWVLRAMAPPRPGGGRPDEATRFSLESAERAGRWSLRWQEAQDNAAKSLAGRYQALYDHLDRMGSLEDGRCFRVAGLAAAKPPATFAEIARFFRPVDECGIDRVVPQLVANERPLRSRGPVVTAGDRVEIAGRVYRAILDEAVERYLASSRAGAAGPADGAIFDALLAERLGYWSSLWRQAEDEAGMAPDPRSASARSVSVGSQLVGLAAHRAVIKAHVERMSALESGRFLQDALSREGPPAVDTTKLLEFAEFARFFRIEAENDLPEAMRSTSTDVTASGRAMAAARIYQSLLDGAARRYREAPREGGAPADVRLVFDEHLAERLGSWSIRWARAQGGEGRSSRFAAVRSHIERMASLGDGRSLRDAIARTGGPLATATPREFAEVARFFRLEALFELEILRSR